MVLIQVRREKGREDRPAQIMVLFFEDERGSFSTDERIAFGHENAKRSRKCFPIKDSDAVAMNSQECFARLMKCAWLERGVRPRILLVGKAGCCYFDCISIHITTI